MKKISLIAAAAALLATAPSVSALEVIDPSGILPQTDLFVGRTAFAQAFRVGDHGWGQANRCEVQCHGASCQTLCDPPEQRHYTILEATAERAIIRNSPSNGGGGTRDSALTREDWDQANGNFVRAFISGRLPTGMEAGLARFDSVTLERTRQTMHYLGSTLVPALDVAMTFSAAMGGSTFRWPVVIRVGQSAWGVGQLLQLEMLPGTGAPPSLRLDGLFLAPRPL